MYSAWFRSTFYRVWKIVQIKGGGGGGGGEEPNFWGKSVMQNVWIIWCPYLYLNFKSFIYKNSFSFIRIQCILHDSGLIFSECWNFPKLKSGHLISAGNQLCRKSKLFCPPFCISILKVLWKQIYSHSLDFNAFYMIQEYFSRSLEISTN